MFALSYSRIEAFNCPFRAQQKYLKKRPEPEGIPLLFGQAGHRFAERYIQHCVNKNLETDVTALPEVFRAVWEEGKLPAEEMDRLKEACAKFVESVIVSPVAEPEQQMAIVASWTSCNWFGKDVFFRAVLDRIDIDENMGVITDYYFGWGKAESKKLQVKIYAALANVFYPEVDRWYCRVFGVQNQTEAEEIIDADQIPRIRKDIESECRRIYGIIDSGKFPAVPGDYCGFCGFVSECPMKELAVQSIGNSEAAIKALQKLIVLDKEVGNLKSMLKTYTAAAGPVSSNSMIIGHHQSETKVYDKNAVYAAASNNGGNPLDYFNVDARKAGKLGIEPEIKKSVRFALKKAGDNDED